LVGICRFGVGRPLVWVYLLIQVGSDKIEGHFLFDADKGRFVFPEVRQAAMETTEQRQRMSLAEPGIAALIRHYGSRV
jgi:hypothetical protein